MKIVIDVIKKNLGKKIVFSDVTWVINKDGVNELKEIINNCKVTTYAQNSLQTEHINMGLICMYCSLDELELWSYCLGQLECDPNLHEQYVLDRRLKDKIQPISDALAKVNKISGNTFDWNDKSMFKAGKHDYGVIAQDVEKVLPELVKETHTGYLGVDYDKIIGLLIEVVKEQEKRIKELENKVGS
jgi:hypothetical protein